MFRVFKKRTNKKSLWFCFITFLALNTKPQSTPLLLSPLQMFHSLNMNIDRIY